MSGNETTNEGEYSRRGFVQTAAAATGAAAGLAGCLGEDDDDGNGNGNGNGNGDADGGDTDDTGEEDFLWWTMRGYIPEETEAIEDAAEGFADYTDDNINFTTNVITWDSVFEEWSAAIQGQETPNVSEMANEHAVDFGNLGAARPNTELFEEHDDWYDATGIWGQYEGEKWGFPWFIEVRNMHMNMDLLDEAGYNDPPETWEELIETAQDVQEETDAESGFGTGGARDGATGQNLYSMSVQAEAEYFSLEDDEWRVELDSAGALFSHLWYASLREEWDIVPGGWGGIVNTDLEDLYRDGRLAMSHQPSDLGRGLIDPFDGPDESVADIAEATEFATFPEGPNGERNAFMGGSCLTAFTEDFLRHDSGEELGMEFIEYMTLPDTMSEYFPAAAPTFLPVRGGQEEIEPFSENNTEIPDQWLEARLDQAAQSVRYGVTDTDQSAPFLGALEGETDSYSIAMSSIIGADEDPKQALIDQANLVREEVSRSDATDYELEPNDEEPDLDDAPDEVQDWITGDGKPQIWNPYE